MYSISEKGINLIKQFEGCRLNAYKAVSTEKYYTIGYGHYGADVTKDMQISQSQADLLLVRDIDKYVDITNSVINAYSIDWINQNKFDALVSFTYNCGKGNLIKLLAEGKRSSEEVSNALLLYVKSGGRTLAGLVRRRKAEQSLFNSIDAKSNYEIALEVLSGKWGNGAVRRIKLTNAGYDYKIIQTIVNQLIKGGS